jgi:integrase/recombinase XerD
LAATRTHLELYRTSMEERGLAASTIDRRLSTACGFYRFAHLDGRIDSNPAQCVRRPPVHPPERRGLDRGELARFLYTAERFDHTRAVLAVLLGLNGLRVSEACDTNVEDMGMERGHRVLHMLGKGHKPALIPLVPRTARTIDLAIGERRDGPSWSAMTVIAWTGVPLTAGSSPWASEPARPGPPSHAPGRVHHGRPRRRGTPPRRPGRGPTF